MLSPGDVAFTLGSGNDTTVVLNNSSEWDSDNICMSVTSLVGGLVMLLGTSTHALLNNFWRISLYVTDDAIAKLYVMQSLVK